MLRILSIFLLALFASITAWSQDNGSDRGGGGGFVCFESISIKEKSFDDTGLLKRDSIENIKDVFLLDFYEPQKNGWARPLDMNQFASIHTLRSSYRIPVDFAEQFTLNESGYRQRQDNDDFPSIQKKSEKFYLAGIDLALKDRYSFSFYSALQTARKKLPFSKWIDSKRSIGILQDQGSINVQIPAQCGYVQFAIRNRTVKGWQVTYDRELVEKKISPFMLAMLRIHEEVYLVAALLKNYQVDWKFYNSEKIRNLTQTLFSGTFHALGNQQDYCRKYLRFQKSLEDLNFKEGLSKLGTQNDKKSNCTYPN